MNFWVVSAGVDAVRFLDALSLGRVLSAPIPWRLQAWFRDMAQNSVL